MALICRRNYLALYVHSLQRSHLLADFSRGALEDRSEASLNCPAAVPGAPDLLTGTVADLHVLAYGCIDVRHNLLMCWQTLQHMVGYSVVQIIHWYGWP